MRERVLVVVIQDGIDKLYTHKSKRIITDSNNIFTKFQESNRYPNNAL